MPVAISLKREYELTGNDLNADPCIFPRHPINHVFIQAVNFTTKQVGRNPEQYLGFPFIVKLNGSLIGIYSEGNSHANSARQIMVRSDDNGLTWRDTIYFVAATATYDFSLLQGLLNPGQVIILKTWIIRNLGGVISATILATLDYGGFTYALWSRPVAASGGRLYRTGYRTSAVALFESLDNGLTWTGKSVMFPSSDGRLYSEADVINIGGTTWLAITREDSGANNPLYQAISTDDGVTWGTASLIPVTTANGRQPNLTRISDNSIILATGDRSGVSGYSSDGQQVFGTDTTGITIFRSTDNGTTWGFRTRVEPMYSTDGGQPMVNETTAGRINVVYYTRRTITDSPRIASASLDVAPL